jgi:N,N'-diacetylchitobiose phosphorylase
MSTESTDAATGAGGAADRTLDNGLYTVHLTARGTGWSGFGDRLVTAGADYPEREGGVWLYLRDLEHGRWWPAGLQGSAPAPDHFDAALDDARFVRVDGDLVFTVEVALPRGFCGEARRVTVENRGRAARSLELTSAIPLVLDHRAAYAAHPAFSKLFVQTEYLADLQGLRARRRPRSPDEPAVSAVHLLIPDSGPDGPPAYETDRARFLGRGHGLGRPAALTSEAELARTVGSVLDPILALRRRFELRPGDRAGFTLVLAAGPSPDAARATAEALAEPERRAALFPSAPAPGPPAVRDAATGPAAAEARPGEQASGRRARPTDGPPDPGWESGSGPASRERAPGKGTLRFFNGHGGFSADGREYVIRLEGRGPEGGRPPLPWINVVANESIGFLASESGAGYTWAGNSRLNRLTPWFNDPVTDPHGEALFIRDEETGDCWSPMPGPLPGPGPYEAAHGFGYSRWRHESHGLEQAVWQLVARDDPVKLVLLRVTNRSGRPRRLSAFAYIEWVLGSGAGSRRTVRAERDGTGRVMARNPDTEDFEDAVAFAAMVTDSAEPVRSAARAVAFLGAGGDPSAPALTKSGEDLPVEGAAVGVGDDACAAFQAPADLGPGESVRFALVLGQAGSPVEVRAILDRYPGPAAARDELERVRTWWTELLGRVTVDTPSDALDLMLNGWLPYQDLSCRLHGRSAFYQSGGAYGYRDQLQDVTGLIYHDPGRARRQILLHAAHQFPEGDVLHWWHPPAGRGIRTRFSDDLLWLPHTLGYYLDVTGDAGVLDERTTFVEGPPLDPGEDERYFRPDRSDRSATVYEHACLAIDRSLTRGAHALPLMGTGDWNDGMNRVGREGRGESVWLGFFLASILRRWIPLCRDRGDGGRAARYAAFLDRLETALGEAGWDGAWYRRAYYDDGAPIGSRESDECRIDAIAQAWSVLSGVASPERAHRALDSLEERLVDDEAGLIRLLTPPFDRTPHDPGYIKGYVPGVRENGGQYTHGVLWAIRAMAELGRRERAEPLLEMLLPIHHADTPERVARYRVEPYVVAADVYGEPPHVGRGGWTWYTGSAGWMYRVALESILGFTVVNGERLRLRPCIPRAWPGYRIDYRLPESETRYRVRVRWHEDVERSTVATVDDAPAEVREGVPDIPLIDDGGVHVVEVRIGNDAGPTYPPRPWNDGAFRPPGASPA